jgi:hypothetical protein
MLVIHPRALDEDAGPPPAAVDVRGETVAVGDDGTFEVDNETWLQRFADRHGVDADTLLADRPAEDDPTTDEDSAGDINVEELADEVIADHLDDGVCPWCDDYEGDAVAQHASAAHTDAWADWKDREA